LVVNPATHHKKVVKSSRFDFKAQHSSVSGSNLFSSEEKRPKIPKKFSNLKTIQDMQSFINEMNRKESQNSLNESSRMTSQVNLNLSKSNIYKNSKDLSDRKHKIE
jgi:hypothetical protein